jgi:DNA processing protein
MSDTTTKFPIRQLRSADFPELLRETPHAPKSLYIRGELPAPRYIYLCVVGSRASTLYGRRTTQKIIASLARYPVAIISGMALGIDSEAHKAALDVGLPTVAVLPSSCDDESLYPTSNVALARRILECGGALVSENKAPWKAHPHDFTARNRIMAGMSLATLVIEAGVESGTLVTAKLALDYNREVLAIPHELGRDSGEGANRLIREGATLVRSGEDVLQALGLKADIPPAQTALPTDLTTVETKILGALNESLIKDDLIEKIEVSAQDANIALSSLLIRGLITERLGKIEKI